MDHGRWLDRTRNPMKRPLVGPRFIQRLNLFLLLVFPVLLNETVMAAGHDPLFWPKEDNTKGMPFPIASMVRWQPHKFSHKKQKVILLSRRILLKFPGMFLTCPQLLFLIFQAFQGLMKLGLLRLQSFSSAKFQSMEIDLNLFKNGVGSASNKRENLL